MSARRWGVSAGLGLILFAILLALTAFGIWKLGTWIGFFLVYSWVFNQVTSYGVDSNLAKIASVVIGCIVWFGALRLMRKRLIWGAIIVIALIIAQSSFLYVVSRNRYFNPTSGSPTKYYTMNPVSGQYQLFDRPIYDAFGQQAVPVTAEIATKIERRKNTKNCANDEVAAEKIKNFFDPESGQALVFYCKDSSGKYRLFNTTGFDPKTGQKLEPVDTSVVAEIMSTKAPAQKPTKQGLMIFQNTDSAGLHTVCDFSGDYQILSGKSMIDSGAIKHGVSELGRWKTGLKVKVRYRSWGGKYVSSDYLTLDTRHYILVNFPPPQAQSTKVPAQAPALAVATNAKATPAQQRPRYASSSPSPERRRRPSRAAQARHYDRAADQLKAYNDRRAQQAYLDSLTEYYASVAARQKQAYYSQPVHPFNPVVATVTTQPVRPQVTYRNGGTYEPGEIVQQTSSTPTQDYSYRPARSADPGQVARQATTTSTPTYSYHSPRKADPGQPVLYSPAPVQRQLPICPNCGQRH